jgi:hypothetical protein
MKMYCECITYESYFSRNEPTLKRETNERYLTGNHLSEDQHYIISEEVKIQYPSYFTRNNNTVSRPTLKRETNERYLTGNHLSMTEEEEEKMRIICEEVKRQNPSYFPDK